MKIPRKSERVDFSHKKVKYEGFDTSHPYFVVKDGKVVSCHQNYEDASRIAPYSGGLQAGKKGGPAMTTSESGLRNQGIRNPIPTVEKNA